jgi:hypothetical protein
MSFSNDRFQIFFNQTPCLKREDTNSPPKSSEKVAKLNFSSGGIYQTNLYNNETLNLNGSKFAINTVSNDAFKTSTLSFPGNNAGYSSTYQHEAYTEDALNYSDNAHSSTPLYNDDMDDDQSSMLDNTRKIRKERLGQQMKSNGNKKHMQNALKLKTKRNPWQPEEDDQVIELVAKYGQSWALIASLMKDRSGKQIRDRYLNKLKPDINKGEWSQAEDELLMSLCRQIGHKWSKIATYLPGRTEGQVKNRFYSHIKKRMGKWTGSPDGQSLEDEETYKERSELLTCTETDAGIKEEPFYGREEMRPRSIQTINCAGNYKILSSAEEAKPRGNNLTFSSLNIKLNTTDNKNLIRPFGSAMDPTDVISYSPMFNQNVVLPPAEEVRSPGSQNGVHLSSTRASSLSQDREFDEVFDKMASMLKRNPQANNYSNFVKPNGISFSISNGGVFSNTSPVKKNEELQDFVGPAKKMVTIGGAMSVKSFKEVSQLDFSNSQHKFNVRIC